MKLKRKKANTKKYFIILDLDASTVNWKELYNPLKYELILIACSYGPLHYYESLKNNGKLKYFSKIIKTKSLQFPELQKKLGKYIHDLTDSGIRLSQIKIIGNNEGSLLKTAKLREFFKLKGPKVKDIIHFRNKVKAKIKLRRLKKYLPNYLKFENLQYQKNPKSYLKKITNKLKFPLFAKPIDLTASFNTCKINNLTELKNWCERFTNNSLMEIDEFIPGNVYHCDSFIKKGKILRSDIGVYFRLYSKNGYEPKLGSTIDLPKTHPLWYKIAKFNKEILKQLKPPNGCTHLEFIRTKDGRFKFLECAARAPGEIIPELRKISTGIDCDLVHYQLQMGLNVDVSDKPPKRPYSAGALIFATEEGVLEKINKFPNLKSIYLTRWNKKIGAMIQRSKNFFTPTLGVIILVNDNFNMLKKDFKALANQKFYKINRVDPQAFMRSLLDE